MLPSAANGVTGFGPVPRSTIAVKGKGQIRDWPKKAPYHTGDLLIINYHLYGILKKYDYHIEGIVVNH